LPFIHGRDPRSRREVPLRQKAILIICVTMIGVCLMLALLLGGLTLRGYTSLERDDTARQVDRAVKSLHETIDRIASTTGDWAPWDETYSFVAGANPGYVADNLMEAGFSTLGLSMVALYDLSGRALLVRSFDLVERKFVPSPSYFDSFPPGDRIFSHADVHSGLSGILRLPGDRLMLVASRPVTTSDFKAPVLGFLIMGRTLNAAEIARMSAQTSLELSVARLDDPAIPSDFAVAAGRLAAPGAAYVQALSGERVGGYSMLPDLYGEPAAILRASLPRSIHKQGLASLGYIMIALAIAAVLSSVLVVFVIERLVLRRLSRLGAEIDRIGETHDLGARVEAGGDDELSSLAGTVNDTLEELQAFERGLEESLAEKEMLLREIHHRVKNNLQVVSSLLSLQSERMSDDYSRGALKESESRVHSMGLIHELLYQGGEGGTPDLARVDFLDYLRRLSSYLMDAYRVDQSRISIEVSGDDVFLDADTAITCGLIVNELVSNSLKHAFPGGRKGRVSVGMREEGRDEAALFVRDDGVGFPRGIDLMKSDSMGWLLITTLSLQLKGTLAIDEVEPGSSVRLAFPRRSD
jgi:two-component sensor histidine kinase/sensor domain CHASE-containing protein